MKKEERKETEFWYFFLITRQNLPRKTIINLNAVTIPERHVSCCVSHRANVDEMFCFDVNVTELQKHEHFSSML